MTSSRGSRSDAEPGSWPDPTSSPLRLSLASDLIGTVHAFHFGRLASATEPAVAALDESTYTCVGRPSRHACDQKGRRRVIPSGQPRVVPFGQRMTAPSGPLLLPSARARARAQGPLGGARADYRRERRTAVCVMMIRQ
jgi:hypothetical protein